MGRIHNLLTLLSGLFFKLNHTFKPIHGSDTIQKPDINNDIHYVNMSIDIINNNGYVIIDIISIIFMAMKRLILKIYSIVKIIKGFSKAVFNSRQI